MNDLNLSNFPHRCPWCEQEKHLLTAMDAEGNTLPDKMPIPGDVSLCFQCGNWSVFDDEIEGRLRRPTDDENIEIGLDPMLRSAREAWVKVNEIMPNDPSMQREGE